MFEAAKSSAGPKMGKELIGGVSGKRERERERVGRNAAENNPRAFTVNLIVRRQDGPRCPVREFATGKRGAFLSSEKLA